MSTHATERDESPWPWWWMLPLVSLVPGTSLLARWAPEPLAAGAVVFVTTLFAFWLENRFADAGRGVWRRLAASAGAASLVALVGYSIRLWHQA
jgi:hypothetical protein